MNAPGQPPLADGFDVTAENPDDSDVPAESEPVTGDLPLRPVSRVSIQPVRRMDDPEILERVLEGLVNLV